MVERRADRKQFRRVSQQESQEMQAKHRRMNAKYIADAEMLLKKGDYLQASEKFWGAVAQMIKTVAAKRGIEIGTHSVIAEFVSKLDREFPELGLWDLFIKARELHSNFYEDELPPDRVKEHANASRELIERLRYLLSKDA